MDVRKGEWWNQADPQSTPSEERTVERWHGCTEIRTLYFYWVEYGLHQEKMKEVLEWTLDATTWPTPFPLC